MAYEQKLEAMGFQVIKPQKRQREEPNGSDNLIEYYGLGKIYGAAINMSEVNYLKDAPGDSTLFKRPSTCLEPLAHERPPSSKPNFERIPKEQLLQALDLKGGTFSVEKLDRGEQVRKGQVNKPKEKKVNKSKKDKKEKKKK